MGGDTELGSGAYLGVREHSSTGLMNQKAYSGDLQEGTIESQSPSCTILTDNIPAQDDQRILNTQT
ncbi:MAG: hypothetical protein LBF65_03065 [Holosporales bacterium]|nr:hypothetical protein [Holosporales bacterium]